MVGWQRWREIDEKYGFGLLKRALRAMADAGRLDAAMVDPYAHLLLAALIEAAFLVSRADETEPTRLQVERALDDLLLRLLGGR